VTGGWAISDSKRLVVGQVSLSPAGTRLDFLYGPALSVAYRIVSAKAAEAPPDPPEIETN